MKAKYRNGWELSAGGRAADSNNGAAMISNEAKNRRVIFMERCYKGRAKKKRSSDKMADINN
jgi:hypothetical protein